MRALVLTSGGLIAARVLNAWISGGHSVAALWFGPINPRSFLQQDRTLGLAAPTWSLSALARRYRIPVECHPRLSDWAEAGEAIKRLDADVLITAMTHEIVPESVLNRFPGRAVNFHPALLPNYRGPNPRAGMILDGEATQYGGVTLHCLSPALDEGDIIGFRPVPYDNSQGFIHWNVRQAHAAGDLVEDELQRYLNGTLKATPQRDSAVSYRRVRASELTLSQEQSASHAEWLCDRLSDSGWIRFRQQSENETTRSYVVGRFIRRVGPRTFAPNQISGFAIEFDAADARVRVARRGTWARLVRVFRYWVAIARTRRSDRTART